MTWSILRYLRENPDILKDSMRKRGLDPSVIDEAKRVDEEWRKLKRQVDEIRHRHNVITRQIASARDPEERRKLIEEARRLLAEREELEKKLKALEEERERILLSLPNIVHDSVPVGFSDEENVPIRFWGRPRVYRGHLDAFKAQTERWGFKVDYELIDWKPVGHADMLEYVLKLGNTMKAAEVAGSRFYYLFDDIVWLDFALLLYAIDRLTQKGYRLVLPPYMIRHKILMGVIDMETFKDAIYKVEDEDLYLIATAEHPLAGLYYNEEIMEDELPIKLVGISPCFRKEAGAGNRDLKGIFRVHQFHKVEQFVYAKPEESWDILEELIRNAEELFQGLGLPYRVVNVVSGELGAPAAKKYDLEVWMPAQGKYREMVSASNTTDWQSYRLNIRLVRKKDMKREYVHTLNSTAIASTRTITAILENFQEPDGTVVIPKVLRKYLEIFPKAPKDAIHPVKKVRG
ncbi:serine--tRNA ligase [Hyperthermus butylicus]|uniref:Serine--tRNA ligase n=1 Tax=Hyperthermus butylicus (strain DSM 5456 / JCM 9403 / PLM1-5) TaxID=415426 RepID=SYS_HYPBU|nr:serine--tRNA ligase [Hyperthermus butylicus]A2BM70.1 RecName: Full=Serine--tRNA ligase; AltName: Full=Seryl-tRNA synthetase; Short=SerRS; AltName: Full=Seryl-tRNA(Ser/Sec) synthetase [Hyperthermus butylicus DSM 5456]ABM81081.1 Seryl-tRNA synthetase [Hyperthermus butylicus DSM 5456]